MSVNHDQAIFDAIAAATSYDGGILISVQKFIDTFNGHRDRALCTSLSVAQAPRECQCEYPVIEFGATGCRCKICGEVAVAHSSQASTSE